MRHPTLWLILFALALPQASFAANFFASMEVLFAKRTPYKIYELRSENGTCHLRLQDWSEKEVRRTLERNVCEKTSAQFSTLLSSSVPQSEMITDGPMYGAITIKSPKHTWTGAALLDLPTLCNEAGQCSKPEMSPLRELAQHLLQLGKPHDIK